MMDQQIFGFGPEIKNWHHIVMEDPEPGLPEETNEKVTIGHQGILKFHPSSQNYFSLTLENFNGMLRSYPNLNKASQASQRERIEQLAATFVVDNSLESGLVQTELTDDEKMTIKSEILGETGVELAHMLCNGVTWS